MEIIIGLILLISIGYVLIKILIKVITFLMNPLIKWNDRKNDKTLKIKKLIKVFDNSEKSKILGVFYKINHLKQFVSEYQLKYFDAQFYFKNYDRRDGEWINKGDILCYVKTDTIDNFAPIYAPKSGYLEHTKENGVPLSENDELSVIHDKGKYIKENAPKNGEYLHYFNINNKNVKESRYSSYYSLGFRKWTISDGAFIKENDNVYQYENSEKDIEIHKAEKSGYIDICDPQKSHHIDKNELLYIIRDSDTQRINQKYVNKPNVIFDEFTNTKIIEWENVSTPHSFYSGKIYQGIFSKSDDSLIDLLFTFNFFKGKDYMVFHFNPKQIRLKPNDSISFLFENDEKIDFLVNTNPISSKNSQNEKIIEVRSLITKSELELFANQKFKKWKLKLLKDDKEILGGNIGEENNYKKKSNLIIVINKFAREYIELVNKEIKNYKPTIIRELANISPNQDETCYVYLMHDTANNYYKIGISNKPKYRERTLQSEKPTIEMIISKKFPIRKIAESFEKALHETYSAQRVRGEWFQLTEKDVENIKLSLK